MHMQLQLVVCKCIKCTKMCLLNFKFCAEKNSTTLDTRIFAYLVGGISGELDVPEDMKDACLAVDVGCPVHVHQQIKFRFLLTVINLPTDGNLIFEIALQGDDRTIFMCAQIEFYTVFEENRNLV